LIRADVLPRPGLDLVVELPQLAFESGSLRAIVLCDLLHHVTEPAPFLHEAARCLRPGGSLIMIEPWVTPWTHLVWRLVSDDPVQLTAGWEIDELDGPLTGANLALPWILFERDFLRLQEQVPALLLRALDPLLLGLFAQIELLRVGRSCQSQPPTVTM
jgi:SAM-dependent methyltransferase